MRKIESDMNRAIRAGRNFSNSNTTVQTSTFFNSKDAYCEESKVFLHGNHIATVSDDALTLYSGGGWFTPTTKSRLNALIQEFGFKGSNIFQKNFNWYVRAFGNVTPFVDGISIPIV